MENRYERDAARKDTPDPVGPMGPAAPAAPLSHGAQERADMAAPAAPAVDPAAQAAPDGSVGPMGPENSPPDERLVQTATDMLRQKYQTGGQAADRMGLTDEAFNVAGAQLAASIHASTSQAYQDMLTGRTAEAQAAAEDARTQAEFLKAKSLNPGKSDMEIQAALALDKQKLKEHGDAAGAAVSNVMNWEPLGALGVHDVKPVQAIGEGVKQATDIGEGLFGVGLQKGAEGVSTLAGKPGNRGAEEMALTAAVTAETDQQPEWLRPFTTPILYATGAGEAKRIAQEKANLPSIQIGGMKLDILTMAEMGLPIGGFAEGAARAPTIFAKLAAKGGKVLANASKGEITASELAARIGAGAATSPTAGRVIAAPSTLASRLDARAAALEAQGSSAAARARAVASRAATQNPGVATNEALAAASGKEFAAGTGAALKPGSSAAEIAAGKGVKEITNTAAQAQIENTRANSLSGKIMGAAKDFAAADAGEGRLDLGIQNAAKWVTERLAKAGDSAAVDGYLIKKTGRGAEVAISKDGFHIGYGNTIEDAVTTIKRDLAPDVNAASQQIPGKPATGKMGGVKENPKYEQPPEGGPKTTEGGRPRSGGMKAPEMKDADISNLTHSLQEAAGGPLRDHPAFKPYLGAKGGDVGKVAAAIRAGDRGVTDLFSKETLQKIIRAEEEHVLKTGGTGQKWSDAGMALRDDLMEGSIRGKPVGAANPAAPSSTLTPGAPPSAPGGPTGGSSIPPGGTPPAPPTGGSSIPPTGGAGGGGKAAAAAASAQQKRDLLEAAAKKMMKGETLSADEQTAASDFADMASKREQLGAAKQVVSENMGLNPDSPLDMAAAGGQKIRQTEATAGTLKTITDKLGRGEKLLPEEQTVVDNFTRSQTAKDAIISSRSALRERLGLVKPDDVVTPLTEGDKGSITRITQKAMRGEDLTDEEVSFAKQYGDEATKAAIEENARNEAELTRRFGEVVNKWKKGAGWDDDAIDAARAVAQHLEKKFPKNAVSSDLTKASDWNHLLSAVNLPRALETAWDLSAPLRQGMILTVAHPISGLRAGRDMFRAFASEGAAREIDNFIKSGDNALDGTYKKMGLEFTDWDGALAGHEEGFMTNALGNKLGSLTGFRGSQRAYTTYLNKLRADVADNAIAAANVSKQGGFNDKELEALGAFINHATGRGDLVIGKFDIAHYAPALNTLFYSPRFATSRVQVVGDALAILKQPTNRATQMAAADMAKYVGFQAGMLGLAKAAHESGIGGFGDVELDPRSPDAGKIIVGDNRIDLWGGEQQWVRFAVQFATGEKKYATGQHQGEIIAVPRITDNFDSLMGKFVRSKLSPLAGRVADYAVGQSNLADKPHGQMAQATADADGAPPWDQPFGLSYSGKTYTYGDLVTGSQNGVFTPLAWGDMIQAVQHELNLGPDGNVARGVGVGALSVFGAGIQTYTSDEESQTGGPGAGDDNLWGDLSK